MNANDPNFALIPAGYKTNLVYQQVPRQNYMTFARTSKATRINKDGYIEEIASGTPRIDYELSVNGKPSLCPSILLEEERTNEILDSADFDAASWVHTSVNVQAEIAPSPDGLQTADKLQVASGGIRYAYDNISLSTIDDTFFSCFAKAGTTGWFALGLVDAFGPTTDEAIGTFDLINGVVGDTTNSVNITPELEIQKYPNGWYRCILIMRSTSSAGSWGARVYASVQSETDLTGFTNDYVVVWGAQVEQSYPGHTLSSYIPSSGGATLRGAETLIQSGGSGNLLPSNSGLIYAEMKYFNTDFSYSFAIGISDGTAANYVALYFAAPNIIRGYLQINSVNVAIFDTTDYDVTQWNKCAFSWKDNDFRFYVNGELIDYTSLGFSFPPETLNGVEFGAAGGGTSEYQGRCKEVQVYDTTTLNYGQLNELLTTLTT